MHKTERIYFLESKIRYRTRNQPGGLRFSIISCCNLKKAEKKMNLIFRNLKNSKINEFNFRNLKNEFKLKQLKKHELTQFCVTTVALLQPNCVAEKRQ